MTYTCNKEWFLYTMLGLYIPSRLEFVVLETLVNLKEGFNCDIRSRCIENKVSHSDNLTTCIKKFIKRDVIHISFDEVD